MREGGRADSRERLRKQRYNTIVKSPEQKLTGEPRSTFIEQFIAEDRLRGFPVDDAVAFDENFGALYSGNLRADLVDEIERVFELYPSKTHPLPDVVAGDLLDSVHTDALCVLSKLPASKLEVSLLLAHLEASGHELAPEVSVSIARRAMLLLLNSQPGIPHSSSCQITRERPAQLDDGSWRIGHYTGTFGGKQVLTMRRSEVEDPTSPYRSELEDARTSGSELEDARTPRAEVEGQPAPHRRDVRGQLMLREQLVFGDERLEQGTVLDWMVPTDDERRALDRDYEADRERMGSYARPWVIVEHAGKRRRIPGSAVKRL